MSISQSVSSVAHVMDDGHTLFYYLSLQLLSDSLGVDSAVPSAVPQIAALMATLPKPSPTDWAALAQGLLPDQAARLRASRRPRRAAGSDASEDEEGGSARRVRGRTRMAWSPEKVEELRRLVDDDEYRRAELGSRAYHGKHINWSAVTHHLGFASPVPVKRKYEEISSTAGADKLATGRQVSASTLGTPKSTETYSAPGEVEPHEPATTMQAHAAVTGGDWDEDDSAELIRLVRDETVRKQTFGKRSLKWSRIADHFEKSKKECKRQFTRVTGEEPE